MKTKYSNIFKKLLTMVLAFALVLSVFAGTGVEVKAASNTVNVYRLSIDNGNKYFFTDSATERDALVKQGWKNEGVAWVYPVVDFDNPGNGYTPPAGVDAWGTSEVHRLVNRGGYHFFTDSLTEKDGLVKQGWIYEGVAFRSPETYGNNKSWYVPVYRVSSPKGYHLFTTSASERDAKVKAGWKYEGVCWNGLGNNSNTGSEDVSNGGGTQAGNNVGLSREYINEHISEIEDIAREEILKLVNEERAKVGASPLTLDANLEKIAIIRTKETAIDDAESHKRPDGRPWYTILDEWNISYSDKEFAENLAGAGSAYQMNTSIKDVGKQAAKGAMKVWMQSVKGHREAILNPKYKKIGVGVIFNENTASGLAGIATQIFSE